VTFGRFAAVADCSANPSLERTATGWPSYARCPFFASRGQPAAAAQLERWAA
jgi:hypothetical protein